MQLCPRCKSPEDPCEQLWAASIEARPTTITIEEGSSAFFVVKVWPCGATRISRVPNHGSGTDLFTDVYTSPTEVTVAMPDSPETPF
jgi:hypothetical protein